MPRFKYRMQNILDIKTKLEEQAKNEYAQTQARLNSELEKREELVRRRRGFEEESRQLRKSALDIKALAENQYAIDVVNGYVSEQEKVISRVEKELEKKREELNIAMQERKMYEKLKEKAFEAYLEEEKSSEMKAVDELTSYSYGRNNDN